MRCLAVEFHTSLEPLRWGGWAAVVEYLQMSRGPALGHWEQKGAGCRRDGWDRGSPEQGPIPVEVPGPSQEDLESPQGENHAWGWYAVCTGQLFMKWCEALSLCLDLRRAFTLPVFQ